LPSLEVTQLQAQAKRVIHDLGTTSPNLPNLRTGCWGIADAIGGDRVKVQVAARSLISDNLGV